jgi:hypothetical protein
MTERFVAEGKSPAEIVRALEDGTLAAQYGGATLEFAQTAMAAAIAEREDRRARFAIGVAAFSAVLSWLR